MARINRSDVIQKAVNDLAISTSTDKIPNETLDKVQLTYDLNKHFSNFISNASQATTGTITIAVPVTRDKEDFYLTGIDCSYIKDATCDLATGRLTINVTPDSTGTAHELVGLSVISLTAQSDSVHLSLAYPIKLKSGTNVTFPATYTVGVLSRTLSITGIVSSSN